jgi:hypothetical protein
MRFLNHLSGEKDIAILQINSPVDDFLPHVPPDVVVVFNRDDGQLVKLDAIQGLQ